MSVPHGTEVSVSILDDLQVLGIAFACEEDVELKPLVLKAIGWVTLTLKPATGLYKLPQSSSQTYSGRFFQNGV